MGQKKQQVLVWENFLVEVTRKPIRNLYLRVQPPDGRVTVSAPMNLPESEIRRFLQERREWIASRQAELERQREQGMLGQADGSRISLWGTPLPLRVEAETEKDGVRLENGTVVLCLRGADTSDRRMRLIREWYRDILRQEVQRLFPLWERRIEVTGGGWQLRAMRSRWGSCNTRTGKILLNVYLAARPRECLEYVIVHELAHRRIPNHGPAFWALVERYLPDWRARRKLLR